MTGELDALVGPAPSWGRPHKRIDWYIARWVMKRFLGEGEPNPNPFLRCKDCWKLRSLASRRSENPRCRCGSLKMDAMTGEVTLWRAYWAWKRGY